MKVKKGAITGHEGLIDIIDAAMKQAYNDALEDAINVIQSIVIYDNHHLKNEILKLKR